MLVLSRKRGQSVVIAGDIVVSVIEITRGRVQLGISAPPHTPIHRQEVHRRIQQERLVLDHLPESLECVAMSAE